MDEGEGFSASASDELSQSEAVLVILDALGTAEQPGKPAERPLLEGLACLGWRTGRENTECRVLRSFATDAWRRCMDGSLVHLRQNGLIQRRPDGYALTELGSGRVAELRPHAGAAARREAQRVQDAATHVRDLLSLD